MILLQIHSLIYGVANVDDCASNIFQCLATILIMFTAQLLIWTSSKIRTEYANSVEFWSLARSSSIKHRVNFFLKFIYFFVSKKHCVKYGGIIQLTTVHDCELCWRILFFAVRNCLDRPDLAGPGRTSPDLSGLDTLPKFQIAVSPELGGVERTDFWCE